MPYVYRHFIHQNTAPAGTQRIVVKDSSDKQVCAIPLGGLTPPDGEKLYSFGLLSDIHLWVGLSSWDGNEKFDSALTCVEEHGCSMCVIAGDLTQTGFHRRTVESDASTTYLDEQQFANYKQICEKHAIPVYELCGNHESNYVPITDTLDLLEAYTGKGELNYAVEREGDLFILLGQPSYNVVMSDEALAWLGETLAANSGRRCFVFVHAYIEEDSGDPLDVRENSIFEAWGKTKTNAFMDLLRQHKNAVLFHGHSHMKLDCQELDKCANYTEKNGFKSVHVPSLARPRDVDVENKVSVDDNSASEGYIVDVYPDGIHLRGWDFVADKPSPLGTLWIDVPGTGTAAPVANLFDVDDPDVVLTGRFNSSKDVVTYQEGQLVTGYIRGAVGDTFTIKSDKTAQANAYTGTIMMYDETKAPIAPLTNGATATGGWVWEPDGLSGTVTIPSMYGPTSHDGTAWVRFCVAYTDINSIVIKKS